MPSSRTDRDDVAECLRALTRGFDAALEAVLQGDLARVQAQLSQNDDLLAELHATVDGEHGLAELHAAAMAAHGRLYCALRAEQQAVARELVTVRHGRRVLAGYGDPTRGIGGNLQSRA